MTLNMMSHDRLLHELRESPRALHIAVTGSCHVGKTTWLKHFFSAIRHHGMMADGFIEEAIFERDTRIGYDFRDLLTHETIPVARRDSADARYTFYNDAWDFAAAIIRRSMNNPILIVDELGLLEARGGGIMPILQSAWLASHHHLLASVRLSVFAEIEHHIGNFDHVIELPEAAAP